MRQCLYCSASLSWCQLPHPHSHSRDTATVYVTLSGAGGGAPSSVAEPATAGARRCTNYEPDGTRQCSDSE